MLAVLRGYDLIIIKTIKYLYGASIIVVYETFFEYLLGFPVFTPRGTGREELRHFNVAVI